MLKRALALAIMLSFASSPVWAQHQKVGTTVFNFLKTGHGARPIGMGGAFTAVSDDANSLFWNPGGLTVISCASATSTYRSYIAGIQGGYLAYARPQGGAGGFGVGIGYLSFGEMVKKGPNNETLGTGTFSSSAIVPTLGYGLKLVERMGVGVGVKGIYQNIDEYASFGVAVDVGCMYLPEVKGLRVGAVVQNLGVQVKAFDEEKESLPLTVKLGACYQPLEMVTLGLDLGKPMDNDLNFSLGFEWRPRPILAVRAGYYSLGSDLHAESSTDVLGGLSVGLGTAWKTYSLDYALTPKVELGVVHRVSLSVSL